MRVLPLRPDLIEYLKKRQLLNKYEKQKRLFEQNMFYPSLETELMEPREMKIWSFRIDKKYRAMFVFLAEKDSVEVVDTNNHYR